MKKIKLTRLIAVLLILASTALSCQSGTENPQTTTPPPQDSTSSPSDEPEILPPKANYEGMDFNILVSSEVKKDFHAEEQTGEVINDAIYNSNLRIAEELGLNVSFIDRDGSYANRADFTGHIRSIVAGGGQDYDLIVGMTVVGVPMEMEGVFVNLLDLESLDFDNPWWLDNLRTDFTIADKLFHCVGDGSLSMYTHMNVMYFNRQLIEDYKMDDPYALVKSGDWTIDTLISQCKDMEQDLNSDGSYDINDFYGFTSIRVPARSFQTSLGLKIFGQDEDGLPTILGLTDKMVDAVGKMKAFFTESRSSLWEFLQEPDALKMFIGRQSVYMAGYLYNADSFRDMPDDYGIIPYPKYDENQDTYTTLIGTTTQQFFIPVTARDPEMTAVYLENINYDGYKNVIPAYYETTLKDKYSRDDTVQEMLDIIRAGATIDFDFACNTCFTPGTSRVLADLLSPSVPVEPASYFAERVPGWEEQLEILIDMIEWIE